MLYFDKRKQFCTVVGNSNTLVLSDREDTDSNHFSFSLAGRYIDDYAGDAELFQ